MSQPFKIRLPLEQGYLRKALFAVELLDAVTLSRVNQGVEVVADGLRGQPIVNASGLFVWLNDDIGSLRGISIIPGTLPYERVERRRDQLQLPPLKPPLTTIELPPRVDYAFAAGITGVRGTLIKERIFPPVPVADAEVRLRWLDDDGVTWHDASTVSPTNAKGDFVSILRLAPTEVPHLDASSAITVRLEAERGAVKRHSADLKLLQGRVTDPSTLSALIFAWDELQP